MSRIVILMMTGMNLMNNFLKKLKKDLIVCVNHALLGFYLRQSV